MNLEVLTNTRVGMTVNALRKASKDEEVISLSKTLIKHWKKFLSNAPPQKPTSSSSSSKSKKEKEKKPAKDEKEPIKDKKTISSFPPPSTHVTTDAVTLKCREMLAAAIRTDTSEDFEGSFLFSGL